jgi:antitoxin component of MazEF toxin-antitoxin module
MIKKPTRVGDDIALVLDAPLLEELGLDEDAEVEVSTDGQTIIVTPASGSARQAAFRNAADRINRKYSGLFKRLSE